MKLICPLAIVSLAVLSVYGASDNDLGSAPQYDKTAYNLFQPLPSDLMRPINSAVYDGVTDAHTLDSGHIQLDTQLINYFHGSGHDGIDGVTIHHSEELYSWSPEIRVGVLNNVELDLTVGYETGSEKFTLGSMKSKTSVDRFENIDLGPKINLWGNDSGTTAFALSPFVSFPTDHGDILAGVDLPFTWNLPGSFYLKLDSGFTLTDDTGHTHYGDFFNNVSIHRELCKEADAYWYLDSQVTDEHGTPWNGYTGLGLIYRASSSFQIFASMGFGLNSESYDYNPRLGLIYRY